LRAEKIRPLIPVDTNPHLGTFDVVVCSFRTMNHFQKYFAHLSLSLCISLVGLLNTPQVSLARTVEKQQAFQLIKQCDAKQAQEDFRAALALCLDAAEAVEQLGDPKSLRLLYRSLSSIYTDAGNIYSAQGDYQKAIEFFKKALQIDIQIGTKKELAQDYGDLGNTYAELGEYEKAIDYLNKRLQITLEMGDKKREGTTYRSLSYIYISLENYQKALEYLNKRLQISQQLGDKKSEGFTYSSLGQVYDSLGESEKAIECENRYLKIAQKMGDKKAEGSAYGHLGFINYSHDNYQKATEYLNKHLQIALEVKDKQGERNAYGNLGLVYDALGNYQKAIEYHKKLLQGNVADEQEIYVHLGLSYGNLRQYDESLLYQQKAISILAATNNKKDLYYPFWGIARTLVAQGKPELAVLFYKQAVNTIQSTKEGILQLDTALQKPLGKNKSVLYQELADLLLKQNRTKEAEAVLALRKEQAILDDSRSRTRSSASSGEIDLNSSEQIVWQEYISSIYNNELKVYQERDSLLTQIKQIPMAERDGDLTYQSLKPKLKEIEDKISALAPNFGIFLKQSAASLTVLDRSSTSK
jgi:tetratricopeptide (TPR) repeat protein